MSQLLTRDQFREAVFARDDHRCVICSAPAQDAHHILERRLWPDGGYYLENGASLCGECHIKAEQTVLSVEQIREAAGIGFPCVPPHLYADTPYDKWGNPVLPDGRRLRGDLFEDASVQKILGEGNVLGLFTYYVKYPRTYHLPWSPGMTRDDRKMPSLDGFIGQEVVVTVKMDGENSNLYRDHYHARGIDTGPHPSRDRIKALWASLAQDIPVGWRVCGENLFAKHSIKYENLPSYFLMFSIWNDKNFTLSWDETKEWAELLGLRTVPTLYEGIWDEEKIKTLYTPTYEGNLCEGYVVRTRKGFHYRDFRLYQAKYVRKGHVQTHGHWMRAKVEPNGLVPDATDGGLK
jgi:hypothetical protein